MRQTKKLGTDVLKKFKQHLLNKDFFCKLKLIMFEIDKELQMTRNGGAVSDNYINVHKDSGEACNDQVRKMVTHSTDFKQYVWQNRQRMRTVVNNAGKNLCFSILIMLESFRMGLPASHTSKLRSSMASMNRLIRSNRAPKRSTSVRKRPSSTPISSSKK